MKFTLFPPEFLLRRLLLKRSCARIKQVICKLSSICSVGSVPRPGFGIVHSMGNREDTE